MDLLAELNHHKTKSIKGVQHGHINSTTINTDWKREKHLNFEDRCSIKVFCKLKYSMRRIAYELTSSPSTIMYELRRGTGERNEARRRLPEYSAKRGQNRYETNRSCCHKHTRVTADNPFVVWALSIFAVNTGLLMHAWAMRRHIICFPAKILSAQRLSTTPYGADPYYLRHLIFLKH